VGRDLLAEEAGTRMWEEQVSSILYSCQEDFTMPSLSGWKTFSLEGLWIENQSTLIPTIAFDVRSAKMCGIKPEDLPL